MINCAESNQSATISYLSQNPLAHMDMLTPINRGTADIIFAAETGVCLLDTKSQVYMLSVENREIGENLIKMLPEGALVTFHQEYMAEYFKATAKHKTFLVNHQAVYFGKELLPTSDAIALKPLDESYLGIITDNYDVDVGADYLRRVVSEGNLFGGFAEVGCAGAELVGFVGIHEEGSIGFLKIFGKYARSGYGTALVAHITNYQLTRGNVPFAQISVGNEVSLGVFRKLGYEVSAERVYWV